MAALLVASAAGLPGCVFAVGNGGKDDGKRIKDLEARIERAERQLGIQGGGQ
jgi:hypothetical protein